MALTEAAPLVVNAGGVGGGAPDPFEDDAKGTTVTAIFNLANAAIGAGVLAFPYAFRLLGWGGACGVTVLVMVVMMYTEQVLAVATGATRALEYSTMMGRALGPTWGKLTTAVLMVYLVGVLTACMVVVGDQATPVAQLLFGKESFWAQPHFLIPALSAVLMGPLILLPRVEILAPASYLAVAACVYVAVFVVVTAWSRITPAHEEAMDVLEMKWDFFAGVPLITFAFTGHPLTPTVFASVKGHNTRTFGYAVVISTLICAVVYVPVGLVGYLHFGSDTQGDILLNYAADDIAGNIGRVAVTLTVTFAYAINHLPVRTTLTNLLFPRRNNRPFDLVYFSTTACTFVLTVVLAVIVPDLQTVFGLFGAGLGTALVFFFPARLNIRYASKERKVLAIIGSIGICLVGLVVMIAGGTMTVIKAAQKGPRT